MVALEYLGALASPETATREAARANLPAEVRTLGALKRMFNAPPQAARAGVTRVAGGRRGLPDARDIFVGIPVPCSALGLDFADQQTKPVQWAGPAGGCVSLPNALVFVRIGTYVLGYTDNGRSQKITCNVRTHDTWRLGAYTVEPYTGPRLPVPVALASPILRAWTMAYDQNGPSVCSAEGGVIHHGRTSPCFAIMLSSRDSDTVSTLFVC